MRLTLRTMLAYLDDVLDAGDAAALSEKIKESDFASNLVSRIRASISHPKLTAPPVDGKGTGVDPNSVAEYLDSTLPAEKVADFERVCLESDAHLAEVAACHQILTLVLGKPAGVPTDLRERAYRYGSNLTPGNTHESSVDMGDGHRLDRAHAAPTAQAGVDITAQGEAPPAEPPRSKPEVPEYLREGRRKSQMAVLAIVACVLLIFGGFGIFAAVTYFGEQVTVNMPSPAGPVEPADGESPVAPAPSPDPFAPAEDVRPGDVSPEQPVAENPATEEGDPIENRPLTDNIPPVEPPEIDPSDPPPAEPAEPAPMPIPSEDDNPPPTEPPAEPEPVEPPVEPIPEELSPVDVGRYLSGDKVLARMTPDSGWMRLPANTTLRSGDRVLTLPAYRPQIALTSGITLTLDGPTQMEFLRPESEQTSRVKLDFGYLLAITVAPEGAVLGLDLGKVNGTVHLTNADTILAVEAVPWQVPGTNPLENTPVSRVRLLCLSGRIDWIASDGTALPIPGGEQMIFSETGLGQISRLDTPPAWIDDKATSLTDRDAARMLEPRLVADRPLELTLTELANGPRADLRSLAVRGLAFLDNHDLLIPAFNDDAQRSSWAAEYEAAQHALARSNESAAALQKSLQTQRSGNADELFRLLWGYSNEDLAAGADAKLIEYLDHDSQEFRVLAIENLRRITGSTHLYRPEYKAQRRKMYVQEWREDLAAGAIRWPAE